MADISQLVHSAKNGDGAAFGQLYSETCRAVYFTCLSFTKNEEDAKDVMQNVYITAFEKLDSLAEPEKFGAWVNRIAVNKCRDHLAKKNSHPESSIDEEGFTEPVDENILPDEYIENAEKRRLIMEIIRSSLSDTLYQTVIMFYFDGMTVAEIAESMGCPEGTVKYRLNAARAKIKKGVLDYEDKNDEKLHAFVGIPFLARLFDAEARSTELPRLSMESILPKKFSVPDNSTTKSGGKAMLNSLKAKIIAGVCAAVVVGGGVTAGVIIANNAKKPDDPAASQPAFAASSGGTGGNILPPSGGVNSLGTQNADTPEPAPGIWEYVDIEGGISITKYNGDDEYLIIPAEIDGKRVLEISDNTGEGDHWDFVFYDFGEEAEIKEITLPEGMTRAGYLAFAHLPKLKTVHIPDSVTSLGDGAFMGCDALESVILPEGLTELNYTFSNCTSLSECIVPESVEELYDTFEDCHSLTSIVIPANVMMIDSAFENCSGLKDVTFVGGNLTVIGLRAFMECTALESIVIPFGVDTIDMHAFIGCTSLKNVTLPMGLEEIDEGAFENCTALTSLTIPDSVTLIEPKAFDGCTNIQVFYKGNVFDYEHLDDLYKLFNEE